MILMIDNYDSFIYNLYQMMGEIVPHMDIKVYRNDRISVDEARCMKPSHIVISPGPGYPADAGISRAMVRELGPDIPILGVCLGHQAIGEVYGGKVVRARVPVHGKADEMELAPAPGCALFRGLGKSIAAGRYHSLVVEVESLPQQLAITATNSGGEIMGLMHKVYPVFGVQFHPESILTPSGKDILKNFINI